MDCKCFSVHGKNCQGWPCHLQTNACWRSPAFTLASCLIDDVLFNTVICYLASSLHTARLFDLRGDREQGATKFDHAMLGVLSMDSNLCLFSWIKSKNDVSDLIMQYLPRSYEVVSPFSVAVANQPTPTQLVRLFWAQTCRIAVIDNNNFYHNNYRIYVAARQRPRRLWSKP